MRVAMRENTSASKIQKYSNKNDISSCTTIETDPFTELLKTKQLLHQLFELAKKEMTAIYQEVGLQIASIKTKIKQKRRIPQELLEVLADVRKNSEIAMGDIAQKLFSVLIVPKLVKKAYLLVAEESDEYSFQAKRAQSKQPSVHQAHSVASLEDACPPSSTKRITQKSFKKMKTLEFLEGSWPSLESIQMEGRHLNQLCQFRQVNAQCLISINLSNNDIHELSYFKQATLPLLQQLNLSYNKIKHLDGLEQTNFPNLRLLNIRKNYLSKVNQLAKCKFPELLQLDLENNRIQQIENLSQCEFPLLEILTLDSNRISNADPIASCKFFLLKILSFSNNSITSLEFTRGLCLRRLHALIGHNNEIESLEPLTEATFPKIKEIILHNNRIMDIECLVRMNFPELRGFDLENNQIEGKAVGCFLGVDQRLKNAKKKFPFLLI